MRFLKINESQSAHCCFEYTVVDTTKPYIINGEQYKGRFESVCECFEEEHAQLICDALNSYHPSKGNKS